MINPVITYFEKFLDLKQEEKDYIETNIPVRFYKKNDYLLKEGEVSSSFFFIVEGLIRMFYLVDGMEKTTFFYQNEDFVSAYESFTRQIPSRNYLQAIEDTQVAVFNTDTVADIIQNHPRFEMLSRIIMEEELIVYQNMIASFITMNAEQRYAELLKTNAQLLNRIPQYHIATYLGVSPETLSRIRRRIKSKKTS